MRHPPRDVAQRILDGVFGADASNTSIRAASGVAAGSGPSGRCCPLTVFQEAAVGRLRAIIERRGGAVLADAVGLGKTYVALALIEERLRAGGDVVVVIPAALRGLWRGPLRKIGRGPAKGRWRLVSHAQMSRGAAIAEPVGDRLIVVDEAHRFRNPATRRYGALARLVEGESGRRDSTPDRPGLRVPRRNVLFLTATPVNNSLADLYHMVRIFLPDHGLRDMGVPSLRGVFEGDAPDPAGLQAVVRALVVRRSRGMVRDRFGDGCDSPTPLRFPRRAPPRVHRYRDPSLPARVAAIELLELAAYGPGAAPLVRLGLLKRLDSSPAALVATVRRVWEFLATFVDAAEAGCLLRPRDRVLAGDGDPLQLMIVGVVAGPAPPDVDLAALAESARRDLAALGLVVAERLGSGANPDPKLAALASLLDVLAGEKVLVFTEYRDTAEAVWRGLLGRSRVVGAARGARVPRVARIDGSGAWLGAEPAGRRRVVERFAPRANGRRSPPERERVDVLVATDVLAEGLNLQDARHVVSYDLPWNPVRLLQRIGRADRLGSAYDEVVPHLFVPAAGLDAVLGLTRRLRTKLHGIVAAVGEETADELLEGLASGPAANLGDRVAAALRAVEARDGRDPMERLRTVWLGLRDDDDASTRRRREPDGWAAVTVPAGHPAAELEAVVLVGSGADRSRLLEVTPDGRVRPLGPAGAAAIAVALGARGGSDAAVRVGTVIRAVRGYLREAALRAGAPAPLGPRDPAARLARRIRTDLAAAGSAVPPAVVRTAEGVLAGLDAPLPPARARAIARLLDEAGGSSLGDPASPSLLACAAHVLGPGADLDAHPAPEHPDREVVGPVLLVAVRSD